MNDTARFGKVAMLYGGQSAEREVSLMSGKMVLKALRSAGVDAHPVDVDGDVIERLKGESFDRAFIILHGRGGEDGTIQGALEVAGVPYTGSGVLGAALSMDKRRTKLVWDALGIPTAPAHYMAAENDLGGAARDLGFPLVIKPVHEGSSIGVTKVGDDEELLSAWWAATQYDGEIMAEPWIDGSEYTAGILRDEPLPLIRLETPRTFYDYEAKYADGAGTHYHCPCGLGPAEERELQALALRAFEAVGASGWGRVDLMCDKSGAPFFLEVNTAPGMTSHSLVPMAAEATGRSFDDLIVEILETSLI